MFLDKIHLLSCLIVIYALLEVISQSTFSSKMCLEKALTIQALLSQNICPYEYFEGETEQTQCYALCNGTYITKRFGPCVGYTISFKLNKTTTTTLKDFRCSIPDCLLEYINFECTFKAEYTGISFKKTSRNKGDRNNSTKSNEGTGSCRDAVSTIVIMLNCLAAGSLTGVFVFLVAKRLKTYKKILQSPPVFYRPNYRERGESSGERTVTIANLVETEHADIENTIRMEAKAIQVPSYKEGSSSESGSHYSRISYDTGNSAVISSEFIPYRAIDNTLPSERKSSSL